MSKEQAYYVPHGTYWPIIGSIGIATLFVGFANQMHGVEWGGSVMALGFAITVFMMFGWLGQVVNESVSGIYNSQVDRSFRWGMSWFIFSEVMFFAAFFGALFYARQLSVPWLGGADNNIYTPELWNGFKTGWDAIAFTTPGATLQSGVEMSVPTQLVNTWGLPALNTLLLLLSGVTLTFAHHALRAGHRHQIIGWLVATIALGSAFLGFQIMEYGHAYHDGLKLTSGIYGSTFYMLTGFHGFHVTVGVIMLTVILYRIQKGHFTADNHFGFEGVAWYWHFVDVVWLGLFIFVYWL
ncbi:cytochrome c oxidase subunit 3 [bacterium endosymbiont of Bathymodiolus sp. 5 South]|jgi:cytochrome c oxidase subunit 3|uniref:cytochrome c oxidase subunit 3 n=1 Tax=bacterium endosymbiont of Bathymodiolus sp. 5 South TaxID=1181670 RepID=UPI0010B3278D|nr:cytochrome c oxidase subunit 3 [bacterium endosymbiont of Bathymodiolus sp. 5 South]CAC9643065.1 Cytochrome c oxidase polypeptide III (EC 1.9.3.1) [uncultured Gammaproteobacteria bacterium]CAC9661011.1 Cytochrome c oxidase polypeptide III (EC 1.9.3.1) [uncultured Gammaproteobacteria bacterium]SHN90365.1 Cytochrome c oxidase polypeptide III [bacterium endosymbiont of Bathymodiolus sp. 5 South]SSC07520.1 Cytochrome c oxidase polypeptide III [bacterium endosymbiont of Bathymodiolus sp. 5 South]